MCITHWHITILTIPTEPRDMSNQYYDLTLNTKHIDVIWETEVAEKAV